MAAPELRLNVTLDLAAFRSQLGKLAQASAAYYYPVNLTIDRRAFSRQLAALGNIKPVIKINDSQIEAARARVGTLNKSLATLRRATAAPIEIKLKYTEINNPTSAAAGQIGRAVSGGIRGSQSLESASRSELLNIRKMMNEAGMAVGKIANLSKATAEQLRSSIVPAFTSSGKEAVNGLASGLADSSSKIGKIAAKVGTDAINGIKDVLGIASPSKVFKRLGKFSAEGFGIGFFNEFNKFQSRATAQVRQFASVLGLELARVQGVGIGAGRGALTGSPRGGGGHLTPIGPLPHGSQEPWAYNQQAFRYEPRLAQPGQARGANVSPMRERFPFAAAPSIMGTTSSPSMLGRGFPALPPAGGTAGTREASLALRELAAHGRSAARAASVFAEDAVRAAQRSRLQTVSGQMPMGGGGRFLPPGGGVPRGGFPSEGIQGPRSPTGGFPVDDVMVTRNAKLGTVMDVAAASTRNFTASQIPLISGIKSLAGEFGQATKQVLLYGTAYKGLAFLTSLPGQILNAAKSQQQFANSLKVATQDTGTFAKELLYVDNVQRAFGLNLETTRTGFTRLYASMAPTGFDSGSIEKLFTGISAATASLQLTPDKAERVIYAFGQMASKGQIMSEELKGQLGDVLPGALAIFSKAAGMSVKEFSNAMEEGEFTGNRFREVLAKVSDELMNRFGTGAQAAGRSLQGLINTVGGDFTRTLESFAPLANAAAQATLGPLTGILREVSMAAKIAMGEQDRVKKQLEAAQADVSALKTGGADAKDIKAAEQNVAALAAQYEVLNEAATDPAIAQQVKNIEAFVTEIQKAATFTMNLAGVIGSVLNPLFVLLGGNLTSVIGNLALLVLGFNAAKLAALLMMGVINTMKAIEGITAAGAASTTVLAGAFRLLGVQATGAQVATIGFGVAIKGLLISTGIGAVIVLLGSLAAAFLSVGNSAKEAADRAKRSIDSMADAARTGNVSLIENELALNKADQQDLENLITKVEGLKGEKRNVRGGGFEEVVTLPPALAREANRLGVKVAGEVSKGSILGSLGQLRKPLQEAAKEGAQDLVVARRRAASLGVDKPDPSTADTDATDDSDAATKRAQSLESYYGLQDQLAKNFTQDQIDRMEKEYQARVDRINAEFDLREARANSFQKEAIRYERQISNIELKRQKALLDASNAVLQAQGSVAGGASAGAAGAYLQGNIGPTSTGPHFDVKKMGGGYFPREYLDQYVQVNGKPLSSGTTVPGGTFAAHQNRGSHGWDYAFGSGRHAATLTGGAEWMGGSPTQHGEARRFKIPSGEEFQFLHGRSEGIGVGAGAPRPVASSEKRDVVAEQKTQFALAEKSLAVQIAEAQAIRDAAVAWAEYTNAITPIEEQKLQNSLLAKKNDLVRLGMPDDVIEKEMQQFETQQKTALAIDVVNKMLRDKKIDAEEAAKKIAELNGNMATYNKLLGDSLALQNQQKFDQSMGALRNQMELAGIIDPRAELRASIAQENPGYSPEQVEQRAQAQERLKQLQAGTERLRGAASAMGDAFGEAFKGVLTGSASVQEALAGMFRSIADSFADMVSQMISQWMRAQVIGLFQNLLSGFGAAAGGAVGSGFAPLSNAQATSFNFNPGAMTGGAPWTFASGGIAPGGFTAFANGGVVKGPTLGLVGEGRYNEAIVPLPDGKSIPVDLGGAAGGNAAPISTNIVVNVKNGQAESQMTGNQGNQLARELEGAVRQVILKETRPGGLIPSSR